MCTYAFSHTHLLSPFLTLCLTFFPHFFVLPTFLQSLLGDGPLRLLLLPSIHLEALDLLSALILA